MPFALFVLGHAGSGKTQFSKKFIKSRLAKKEAWCLLDKDVSGDRLSNALMRSYGLNPEDKDSPGYKEKVRDLEYQTCLDIAKDQLSLGINVVLPGPWTKELQNGDLFKLEKLGLPKKTKLAYVYLDVPIDKIKKRIETRSKPKDQWKLANWEEFSKTLYLPQAVIENNVLLLNNQIDFEQQEKMVLKNLK